MKRIQITAGAVTAFAELNDSPTAQAIWDVLPVKSRTQTWGEEIYFTIQVTRGQDAEAREVVQIGELGYWSPGQAFCIFFGCTPASRGEEIRAASPVNIIGKIVGDARVFKQVRDGAAIVIVKDEG